jgi:hypothetical protein
MPNYTAQDIVTFAGEQKPLEIAAAFDDLIGQRLYKSIQDKKVELASSIFNGSTDPDLLQKLQANASQEEEQEETDQEETSDEDSDIDVEISDDDLLGLSDEELAELGLDEWDFDDDTDSNSEEDNENENT